MPPACIVNCNFRFGLPNSSHRRALIVSMPVYAALDDRQAAEEVDLFFIAQDDGMKVVQSARDTLADREASDFLEQDSEDI